MYAHSFVISTRSHLSALTAAYFGLGQSKQSRSLPSYGPCAALRGPFAPASSGPARPPTCCASLHLAPSATPKGAAHQGPPDACAQPPEVAKLGAAPGLALAVASWIKWELRIAIAGKPAPTGSAKTSGLRCTCGRRLAGNRAQINSTSATVKPR